MEKWEYKILEFATEISDLSKTDMGVDNKIDLVEAVRLRKIEQREEKGFLGNKTKKVSVLLTSQSIEKIFNDLGKEGWSLCSTVPLVTDTAHAFRYGTRTTSVQFIFKRLAL